ncbi:DEAD/DEAH box helicase family protein [Geomonas sp. RF6]|uniref:DEAD/DEAH box helicase family protein n=1 Tax=Geomonas sp. RF6 TaxID=2897342 RepID=UPI001E2AC71B|nr:DEAD/DEAH box helicase family protein [Geomonas sp. RF6]UFS69465.1 DEAD/DEAH box helicase family protein [Geomonas sp. RF6]
MELKLYNRLKRELLGDLATAAEQNVTVYQGVVERYAPQTESGIPRPYSQSIQGWLSFYNRLIARPVQLRYYQILALYFTEAVLRKIRNREKGYQGRTMLAYWMATGSGKTLLMHLNILQFIDHIGGWRAFDELQIILTTPGVNLIEQHRREVVPLIEKLNQQCAGRIRLTIDSTQSLLNREKHFFDLPDHKRVFRLVLVDEGHIGLSSSGTDLGKFKELRHNLADYPNAFLFEYSATYHGIADRHIEEYGEQIVYDYNYYRFFKDGYGKDFSVARIADDAFDAGRECWENFTTAFRTLADKLAIHQELRVSLATGTEGLPFTGFFPDKPLLAFMGRTVEDSKDEGKSDEVSDIRKLLGFLARLTFEEKEQLLEVFNGQIAGPLTLTRCPAVTDEILLSWGDGEYWGIINVGNGDKFFNDSKDHPDLKGPDGGMLAQLRKSPIIESRFHFSQLDTAASPITVLIGSRKFAEGWNCFRLSVIGLVNLGSTKGNKIIQIFGRGVRLKGLKNDGKRHEPAHHDDYEGLKLPDTPVSRLRRLETLNIFSLKKSYLDTFLKALEADLPTWTVERSVPVAPAAVWVGGRTKWKTVQFDDYRDKLKVFKVGKHRDEPTLIAVRAESGRWCWRYLGDGSELCEEMPSFSICLDYRADTTAGGANIAAELLERVRQQAAFLPMVELHRLLERWQESRRIRLYHGNDEKLLPVTIDWLLELVGAVYYQAHLDERSWPAVERLLFQTVQDTLDKIHHKLIYDINTRRYRYDELMTQAAPGGDGDFIDRYQVTLEFPDQARKAAFETTYPTDVPEQLKLSFNDPRTVYAPLLNQDREALEKELGLKPNSLKLTISPDSLNAGERKFVQDLHDYLHDPVMKGRYDKHEFYLLRNVQSLRSVGVYLESETRAFFPDFVLWVMHKDRTHIFLIDPKGQTGITDWSKLEENEKVRISTGNHLPELARRLSQQYGKQFKVDSFILLRDSSPMGKLKALTPTADELKMVEQMKAKHVLRLDWHARNEAGDNQSAYWDGKTYLDFMFEQLI